MIKIEELKNYTIPYCGNKRIQPYGDLVISDGESRTHNSQRRIS